MDKAEAFAPDFDEINRAVEISYATLIMLSERKDAETDSWAILGVLDQIEKVKNYLSDISKIIFSPENVNEGQLVR
ncbi:MAG: hypothetical protein K2N63_15210 [Lachnospiraceae bacterium]|nr:hypothetical protein [Lachnospiraceae bacterium]